MNKTEKALTYFDQGFVCSQAVFSSYAEELGLDVDMAMKVSTAFGGGMARTAGPCGAVTGALMAIGLKYGRVELEDKAAKDKTYVLSTELMNRFSQKFGSIQCNSMLGVNISSEEGMAQAIEQNLFTTLCPAYIRYTMEILEELL